MMALVRLLAWLALLLGAAPAHAAITCLSTGFTIDPITVNYINNSTVTVQGSFTVSCNRGSTSDPSSISYSAISANNGAYSLGVNNRAKHTTSANYLRYDLYTNSGCSVQWKGSRTIGDTITWSGTGTASKTSYFWLCMSAQTAGAEGLHSDLVSLQLTVGANTYTKSLSVSIYAPAYCTLSNPPGDIAITYAAFGGQQSQTTTFRVTCTLGMTYTLATDVPEGVLAGLRYTLAITPSPSPGTGALQPPYTITVTFPAGQAGSCGTGVCGQTATHTLIIGY